jgi:hypothetical protein
MDRLKELWNDNTKRYAMPAGAVALTLLGGTYAYKKLSSSNSEYGGVDVEFPHQNLPLYDQEAVMRHNMVSNVKYELFLILGQDKHYSGKVNIKFVF